MCQVSRRALPGCLTIRQVIDVLSRTWHFVSLSLSLSLRMSKNSAMCPPCHEEGPTPGLALGGSNDPVSVRAESGPRLFTRIASIQKSSRGGHFFSSLPQASQSENVFCAAAAREWGPARYRHSQRGPGPRHPAPVLKRPDHSDHPDQARCQK